MIKIRSATEEDIEILALLGRITYSESHGAFIHDRNDLLEYNKKAFAVSKIKEDLRNKKNLFYIAYADDFPVAFAKLILNEFHESVDSKNTCLLDKIYVLNEFIPLKIGQVLFDFLEGEIRRFDCDTIWLDVYLQNYRAIRFYQKNAFVPTGRQDFLVNGTPYETIVFSKRILL
ncbi:GNAT family N-acetyltransferase [Cryomorphaceae bacterium 1068]|nr:GNAT family N-acetyltransferase [Cryomorphaceae bacterium 1068]